jgi:serine/threonine protein kinase
MEFNSPDFADRVSDLRAFQDQYRKETGLDEAKKPKVLDESVIAGAIAKFEKWEIDPEDLELQKKIGFGGFTEVYLNYRKSDGTIVAAKGLHEAALEMFRSEAATLADLRHPAIFPLPARRAALH